MAELEAESSEAESKMLRRVDMLKDQFDDQKSHWEMVKKNLRNNIFL